MQAVILQVMLAGSSTPTVLGIAAPCGYGLSSLNACNLEVTPEHSSEATGATAMHTPSSQSASAQSGVPEPSGSNLSDSNKIVSVSSDVVSHPVRSPGSAEGAPVATVQSGYPTIGMFVKLWGPTADANILEEFLASQSNAHAWGFDWRAAAVSGASAASVLLHSLTGGRGGGPPGTVPV